MDQPPQYRIVYSGSPSGWRFAGCAGCFFAVFVVGGIVGVLLFGWKTLLGL
jgi:hypothetical protein